jgi:hypothetical protein
LFANCLPIVCQLFAGRGVPALLRSAAPPGPAGTAGHLLLTAGRQALQAPHLGVAGVHHLVGVVTGLAAGARLVGSSCARLLGSSCARLLC